MNAAITTEVLSLTGDQTITLTSEQAAQIENDLDRALVAFSTGLARNERTGNGIGYAPAWELLSWLERRELVKTESRGPVVTPLVWLTEDGHGVIEDIIAEGAFDAHVAEIKRFSR